MNDKLKLEAERHRSVHDVQRGTLGALKKLENIERKIAELNLQEEREELARREDDLRWEHAATEDRERRTAELEETSRDAQEEMQRRAPVLDSLIGQLNYELGQWKRLIVSRYVAEYALGRAHANDYYQDAMLVMSWPLRIAVGWLEGVEPAPDTAPSTFKTLLGVQDAAG